MILVKPSSTYQHQLLIGSDLVNPAAARREVEAWLAENRYTIPRNSRQLSVFENGVFVREWVLAEPDRTTAETASAAVMSLTSWTRRFQRPGRIGETARTNPLTFLSDVPTAAV